MTIIRSLDAHNISTFTCYSLHLKMPSWWGKPFSKDVKKKKSKETSIGTPNILVTEQRGFIKSVWSKRRCRDVISERGSWSRAVSRSPSPSSNVSRCQSFADRPHSQPLPVPALQTSATAQAPSRAKTSRPMLEKRGKPPLQLPFLIPDVSSTRRYTVDIDRDMVASVSSNCSADSDDPADSRLHSPRGNDFEYANGGGVKSTRVHESPTIPKNSREQMKYATPASQHNARHTSPKSGIIKTHKPSIPTSRHGGFVSAPDSSMSSPCRSPRRTVYPEQIQNTVLSPSKMYMNAITLSSGQCSSPASGQTSGHNSIGGDFSGQFWPHNRGSAEVSPIPSPRITSPGPSSRVHSGAVTPLHPRAGGTAPGSPSCRTDDAKKQSHRLPLPPPSIANPLPFSPSSSSSNIPPAIPRSPGKHDNHTSPGSHWKKGKMIGRGTFGHVYVGFNSESGEMCAMKEVTLFLDDVKSKESARQLAQEISLLSRLRHQNIVQYYGSDMIDDKLYIYLEYVSGGSIYKLLQEYGRFGEIAIRSYTHQILSGLAYLHAKNHVHRDIKGANILVDPNGRVKLADFGMAKHITGQSCPLSFRGSPYWMAPEVIKNSNGCNLAVDIWSLGCTVLEMATSKPPWSQYEGIAAMFKIGNSKELPPIPDHLSEDGKDFIRQCLRREPANRPTAAELLQHPFVKNAAPLERSALVSEHRRPPEPSVGVKGIGHARNLSSLDIPRIRQAKPCFVSSENFRNASCPISPVGSPHLRSSAPRNISGMMSPSPISSPMAISGSSTPLTGGNGAIPLNREPIQLACINDGSGNAFRSNNMYMNISTYQDGRHDNIFRKDSTVLPEFPSDIAGLPSIKSKYGDIQKPYGGVQKVKHISLPY